MPARFEPTICHWLNDSHVLRYVIMAILVSVQREGERETGREGREREREKECVRERSKGGKAKRGKTRARVTETSNLSLESTSAISERDENTVGKKQGWPYRERKATFKARETRRERPIRRNEREKEKKSAIETERSRKEAASVHPSSYSLPPLTTPLHINPPLIRVESISHVYVISRLRSFRVSCNVTISF